MMCDSWWQLLRQICVLAIQTMKSRYSKIIICNLWIEKFDWSFHGMKSEGWASFSCDQGRAGPLGHRAHRCGAHWETLPVVVPLSTMQCSASSDTDQSHVGHTITCHHQCHNTIMQSVIHFTMQHCSSLSCSAILHFSSVRYKVKCSEQWLLFQLYICQTITCHQQCNDDAVVDCLPAGVCHYQLMARCTWDPGQASQGLRCPQL